jgi:hypothetical protein
MDWRAGRNAARDFQARAKANRKRRFIFGVKSGEKDGEECGGVPLWHSL